MEKAVIEQFVVVVSTVHEGNKHRLLRLCGEEIIGPTYPTGTEIANAIIKFNGDVAVIRKEHVLT